MSEENWKNDGYVPSEHGWWKSDIGGEDNNYGYPPNYYFADTVRAILIAFTNFFKGVWVGRYDEKGYLRKKINVPVKFGPRAKSHDQRKELESGQPYYIPLPNIYYKITGFQYDATRASSSDAIRTFYDQYLIKRGVEEHECDLLWQDTMPVPYNMTISMSAKAEKMSDILQILEHVTRRFNPEAFIFIKEFWFMNIRRDIKVKLDQVDTNFPDEFGEQDKRELEVTFSFTIEGQVYTGIEDGAIIDRIIARINPHLAEENEARYKSVIDIKGDYKPESYDEETGIYESSLKDRYDLGKEIESDADIVTSGTKEYTNNANQVINGHYVSQHTIESAK